LFRRLKTATGSHFSTGKVEQGLHRWRQTGRLPEANIGNGQHELPGEWAPDVLESLTHMIHRFVLGLRIGSQSAGAWAKIDHAGEP